MDRQFWWIYHDKCRVASGTHQRVTVANGQRQRRFRSGLANRYCPGILRRAHANIDTYSASHSHANGDIHTDAYSNRNSDGNSNCNTYYHRNASYSDTNNHRKACTKPTVSP